MFKSSQINWLIRIQIDFLSLFIYCRVTWWRARSRPAPWPGSRRSSCRGWSCRCQWRGWPSPCSWSRTRCDSSPGESNMWIIESVVRGQPNILISPTHLVHPAGEVGDVPLPDADVARGVEGEVGPGVEARQLRAGGAQKPQQRWCQEWIKTLNFVTCGMAGSLGRVSCVTDIGNFLNISVKLIIMFPQKLCKAQGPPDGNLCPS